MKKELIEKKRRFRQRRRRVRGGVVGVGVPRLSVFRSSKYVWAQLIDDGKGETVVAVGSKNVKEKGTKAEKAYLVGKMIAERAKKMKIDRVVFDRGGFKYHGRVKALCEGAREGGLKI